ncbi:MAG: ferredoxin [Nanoarchaeota archaeon]|nr:ferredoxin [Nanoarchaeota archaeon]MBU1644500.1 ferredoxin [Nanoarchaeota archaeon]MBU1976504.1 ferredoxin [Nanoarchaeota archaeon]
MVNIKIKHYKNDCISCGACAAVCPDFWKMDEEGFAQLKDSKLVDDHWELNISTLEAKTCNEEAAEVCPVQIIKLEEIKKK